MPTRRLFVVAGPNGAGKSLFSKILTDSDFEVFDGDKHMTSLGLNSLEESIQRVEHRVRLGGHKVAEVSIRYNYEHGFKNLYKHFSEFDSVTLYDNSIPNRPEAEIPKEILYITKGELHLNTNQYPDWVKPIVEF